MNTARRPAVVARPRRILNGMGCPPARPQMHMQTMGLPNGDAGIAKTIRYMAQFARSREGALNPDIKMFVVQMVRGVPNKDSVGEINTIYNWVKQNIQFRGEYRETLQTPLVTLQLGAGDCDDHSTLLAALLMSLGYQVRFRTVAADASAPGEFSHVFCEVREPKSGKWISLDTTVARAYPGWQPESVTRSHAWPALNGMGDDVPPALSPTQQLINTIDTTLLPAVANRIAYGQQPAPLYNSIFGPQYGTQPSILSGTIFGLPTSLVLIGGGLLALVALKH